MIKAKKLTAWAALGVAALMLNGCYTVVKAPYSASDSNQRIQDSDRYSRDDQTIGRFDQDYDYPGAPEYGYGGYGGGGYGGGGYPGLGFGYSSNAGPYGYGAPFGYGYGAGPLGYGSDPYYTGNGGYYAPPGYELVTSNELDRLRIENRNLANQAASTPTSELEAARLKQIERDKKTNVWNQRDPRAGRPTPTPTPRTVAAPRPSSDSSSKEVSSSSSKSSSKSSSTSTKSSAKPKRRRTNR
jgi:hypothetical protein